MNKLCLLIATLVTAATVNAAEMVGSLEAEVVTAACVTKKEGLVSFIQNGPKYQCSMWIESEYGQQHVNVRLNHPVKRGDKLTLIQTGDNTYTVL